jgi:hypothetical protein
LWDKPAIIAAIRIFLQMRNHPVGEYDLIQHLNDTGHFAMFEQDSANLRLFKKHFITRHCLYVLQQDLRPGWSLRLSSLEIELREVESTVTVRREVDGADAGLRDFYLDLQQLEQADEHSVGELLKQFWTRFYTWQSGDDAYQVLELQPDAAWADVQQAYRRAIQKAHPDMGGNAEEFARLRGAYEILKQKLMR